MALTPQQLRAILQQARDAGMSEAEIEGLRDVLLNKSVDLDIGERLRMAINALPKAQRDNINEFVEASAARTERIVSRGRAALEALSDEEWDALVDAANERESS